MLEHHGQPLLPLRAFVGRMARSLVAFTLVLCGSLFIGTLGYHVIAELSWIDSLFNASMILAGMGPVTTSNLTTAAKLFASAYALFSGVVFLVGVAILVTPVLHRLLHKFHLAEDSPPPSPRKGPSVAPP